ncbi:putative transposable element [Trichonephila clavipes]|nr:putative transposable element [Trichonephila clavipes]
MKQGLIKGSLNRFSHMILTLGAVPLQLPIATLRVDGMFKLSISHNDEALFWLNGYVNKQNCRIWSETNPQVYVETRLHPEKLTVWCALWAGGILLQKR